MRWPPWWPLGRSGDAPANEQRDGALAERIRPLFLSGLLVAAVALLGRFLNGHYPIEKWLFWHYAGCALAAAVWALACASAGHVVVRRVLGHTLPFREHLGTSFAAGVVVYYLLMSVAGLLRLYGTALWVLLPAAMLAAGGPSLARLTLRYARGVRHARKRAPADPLFSRAVLVFGLIGLGLVYFNILTPENLQFDSRWKHTALAEQYAATGGVRRFPEGWTVETNPHLATYVYTWGFLLPFGRLFDRIELAAHLEFVIFACTTLMIPALVRRLVPGASARYTWAARFLFPGLFVYDSAVTGGADHIAALFTVPLFALLLRARKTLDPRLMILVAVMLSGSAMAKLTGLIMLMPVVAVVVGVNAVLLAVRSKPAAPRRNAWLGPGAALFVGLVLTSTFWAKNWIWYGDPLYPSLYAKLHLRPWTEDSADLFEWGYKDHQFWRPTRNLDGVKQTLKALFTFPFTPHTYPNQHGQVPTFGFLFTLLTGCLPFLRRTARLWGLTLATLAAVAVWWWTHHQDRYLETLLPWMTATAAGTMILLWRTGAITRVALSALVALQILWAGDFPFLQTHVLAGSPMKRVLELLYSGYRKDYDRRFETMRHYVVLGRHLPPGARALMHDNHVHLGLAAETVNDWGAWSFGISYGRQRTPRDVYDLLEGMGVTHIVWEPAVSHGWDSLAGDIMFFEFAIRETEDLQVVDGTYVARMPSAPPSAPFDDRVAYLGCDTMYKTGLYKISDLTVPVFGPRSRRFPAPRSPQGTSVAELAAQANVLVVDDRCQKAPPGFDIAGRRKIVKDGHGSRQLTIWLRTGQRVAPPPAQPVKPPEPGGEDNPEAN